MLGLSRLQLTVDDTDDTEDADLAEGGGAPEQADDSGERPVERIEIAATPAVELATDTETELSVPNERARERATAATATDGAAAASEAFSEELADAVYTQMLERETEVRQWVPFGGFWGGLLVYRGNVVDWLYEACEGLRLHETVLHLSVHYLDWTMLAVRIPQEDVQTLCMACVLAAAKFHGPECAVPALETVVSFARCTEKEMCDMELRVLFALDWRLNAVTTLQVAEHHLALGVVVPKDGCGDSPRSAARLTSKLRKLSEFLLLQTLYDHRFLESRATLCGAAALAAAREILGLEPWPQLLEQRSGYTRPSVAALAEDVLEQAHSRFPEEFFRDMHGQWVAAGIDRRQGLIKPQDKTAATEISPPASPVADFDRSTVGPGS